MKHKYAYKWTLKDANFTKDKGKVFSCFACGGGCPKTYQEQRIWVNFHLVCYSYLTLYVVGIQLFCVYL